MLAPVSLGLWLIVVLFLLLVDTVHRPMTDRLHERFIGQLGLVRRRINPVAHFPEVTKASRG